MGEIHFVMTIFTRARHWTVNIGVKAAKLSCLLLLFSYAAAASTKIDEQFPKSNIQAAPNFVAPEILSDEDIKLYTRIFSRQEQGRWQGADKLIAKLDNKTLLMVCSVFIKPYRVVSNSISQRLFSAVAACLRL